MNQSQRKTIENVAFEFFHAAHKYVSETVGGIELSRVSAEATVELDGPLFGMNDQVRAKQSALVDSCIRFLGVELGSEQEIEELAWKHVWAHFSETQPAPSVHAESSVKQTAKRFVEQVAMYQQRAYGYIAPNYLLKFKGQAERIAIGPVEALKTELLVRDQSGTSKSKKTFEQILAGDSVPAVFHLGSKFDFSFSDSQMLIELPECCWYLPMGSVKAARRNAEESALWLINIAIGLLRLCHPKPGHSDYPKPGDIEEMPIAEPKVYWVGGRRDERGLVLYDVKDPSERSVFSVGWAVPVNSDVRRMMCTYTVDDAVLKLTEDREFIDKAEQVFVPQRASLAERFGQGLGWLTRGRQSSDRAERFLFFFTAIEALLCGDDSRAPVVQTISRYAAVILCGNPDERAMFAGKLRKLYESRSKLVHAGKRNVSLAQSILIQEIAEGAYRTVMERYPLDARFDEFQNSLSRASYGSCWPELGSLGGKAGGVEE